MLDESENVANGFLNETFIFFSVNILSLKFKLVEISADDYVKSVNLPE